MPSLIQGYNYDIFISYRQKDNKGDKWVSEFVEALKTELESTFKEEISVYFDINPHDGLLETHDVDESLKEKLKCLIFIPIISRTYCDPKAFAWEHEFKAFVEEASKDDFGLKVKLPNGNVASRVLPVQIHDLDTEDNKAIESVLGAFMRSIEFIYREPGVDRPLTVKDNEEKNLNRTNYRNQINKVALAIKDIITAIKNYDQVPEQPPQKIVKPALENKNANKAKIIAGILLAIALIVLGLLFIPKLINPQELEKSVAVLPFDNLSSDNEYAHLGDAITDEIILQLQYIPEFDRVISRSSTMQFKESRPAVPEIAEILGVNYLIEGSIQRRKDSVTVRVQVIQAKNEDHVWAGRYDGKWENINDIQDEIAINVAQELKIALTASEIEQIQEQATDNSEAYSFYLLGENYQKQSRSEESFRYAIQMYEKAVELDPDFALAWVGLAACSRRLFWRNYDLSDENLTKAREYLDKAISLAPMKKEVRLEEATYYYHCKLDYDKSLQLTNRLIAEYPNNDEIYIIRSFVYRRLGKFIEALNDQETAIQLNPAYWQYWTEARGTFIALRDYDKAINYNIRAIELNPSNSELYEHLCSWYISLGEVQIVKVFLEENERSMNAESIKRFQARLEYLSGNFESAIQIANTLSDDPANYQDEYYTKHLVLGLLYRAISDNEMTFNHFEAERDIILDKIKESENDHRLYRTLGITYAGLGMKDQAIEAGRKALEILNYDIDKFAGWLPEFDMVRMLLMVGEYDEALTQLEIVISRYGTLTVEELKLDPFWDPVRDHEKFQEIINNPAYQVNL